MVIEHTDIYTDLDILPIYNFDKCMNGELKYLFPSKKGVINKDVEQLWEKMYNAYCLLTVNNESLTYYRLIGEIAWLEKRLIFVPILLNLLLKTPNKDKSQILKELSAWKFSINEVNPLESEIELVITALNNSKTKLKRKIDEYKDIKEKPKDGVSLAVQKAKLHRLLNIDVNTRITSVTEWLAYWGEVKLLSKKDNG